MVSSPRVPETPEKRQQKCRKKDYGVVIVQTLADAVDFHRLEVGLRRATADEARRLAIALRAAASSADLRSLEAETETPVANSTPARSFGRSDG